MKMNHHLLQIMPLFLMLLLAACSQPQDNLPIPTNTPQPEPGSQLTGIIFLNTPSATITVTELPFATPSPYPTFELLASATPTQQATVASTQPLCTNVAEFDRHLSISDGSILDSGLMYGKVWRVKNAGTCTWTTDYKLMFIEGDASLNQTDIPLPHPVQPGETVELKITFVAPEEGKTYVANWKLADENGALFGVGSLADQPIGINFIIEEKIVLPQSC